MISLRGSFSLDRGNIDDRVRSALTGVFKEQFGRAENWHPHNHRRQTDVLGLESAPRGFIEYPDPGSGDPVVYRLIRAGVLDAKLSVRTAMGRTQIDYAIDGSSQPDPFTEPVTETSLTTVISEWVGLAATQVGAAVVSSPARPGVDFPG